MLLFKYIKFKNIISYGNYWTTINFENSNNVLIYGKNGSGKSSGLLDSLCFVLYSKPFRKITKSKLINFKNKNNLVVEIVFVKNNNEFKVIRCVSPSKFEIYKNNVLIDQPSIKDYQDYLEKDILGIDFQSFIQIIVLGKANNTSFLKLSLADRRKFIENILDLSVFSKMNILNKSILSDLNNKLNDKNYEINILNKEIDLTNKHLVELENEIKRQNDREIELIDDHIKDLTEKISNLKDDIFNKKKNLVDSDKDQLNLLSKSLSDKNNRKYELLAEKKQLDDKILFFSHNDICPICENNIDSHLKHIKNEKYCIELEKINSEIEQLKLNIQDITKQISYLQKNIDSNNKIQNEILFLEKTIKQSEQSIDRLKINKKNIIPSKDNNNTIVLRKEELILKTQSLERIKQEGIDIQSKIDYHILVSNLLKDDGIKTIIIDRYIPSIVEIMNRYLHNLGLYVTFELNSEFEEKILHIGMNETLYDGFSEGEKFRIDLSMLLTWRELCRIRNNMFINILVFDELLDGSLDESGIENLLSLFKNLKNNDVKVIVISHDNEKWKNYFDEMWYVFKKEDYTQIEINHEI